MIGVLRFLLHNHVFTTLSFFALFVFGLISFFSLKVELLPEIKLPAITVITFYPRGSAEEIEALVTEKIENSLSTIEGLNSTRSLSSTGYSVTELFFEWGYPLDQAVIDVRKNLDFVKNLLPKEADRPIVFRGISKQRPTLLLAVNNLGYQSINFQKELEKNLASSLKQVEGVGKVEIKGLTANQVQVTLEPGKLSSLGLNFQDVADQIARQNLTGSLGYIEDDFKEYPVKIVNTLDSLMSVRELPISILTENTASYVELGELGSVRWGKEKLRSYAKLNGEKVVLFYLFKENRANTIEVVERVRNQVEALNDRYQGKIKTEIIYEQATFISEAINQLFLSTLIGFAVGFIVLSLFYRSMFISTMVLLSIPVSFILIFFLMYFTGISINLMTLGGMALGSGMILDASVVVLDRLLRINFQSQGVIEEILSAVSSVIGAILSSTISTLVVFVPVLFLKGLLSTIFREMALIVTFSLIASIFYSVTFLPVMVYLLSLTRGRHRLITLTKNKVQLSFIKQKLTVISTIFHNRFLSISVIGITIVLGGSFFFIKKEIIPFTNMGKVNIKVELPPQSSLANTEKVEEDLFSYLDHLALDNKVIFTEAGRSEDMVLFYENQSGINRFTTSLVYKNNIRIREDLENYLTQEFLIQYPSLRITVEEEKPAFADFIYSPLVEKKIILTGSSRQKLNQWLLEVEDDLDKQYKEVESLELQMQKNTVAVKNINQLAAANEIWNWLNGNQENFLVLEEDRFDILLQLPETERENFFRLPVKNIDGNFHSLNSFTELKKQKRRTDYYRMDHKFIEYLNSDRKPLVLSNLTTKPDHNISIIPSYQENEIRNSQNNFLSSLLLSIFLIYMTISTQFNSFVKSLPVLFIILPSIVFTLGLLLIISASLNIFSGIGLILVAGSSVNNAILIFEVIPKIISNSGLNPKEKVQAIISERVVPVTITSTTTILALAPIAFNFSQGNEFNSLISICLISGVMTSFFFSLIYLPAAITFRYK